MLVVPTSVPTLLAAAVMVVPTADTAPNVKVTATDELRAAPLADALVNVPVTVATPVTVEVSSAV